MKAFEIIFAVIVIIVITALAIFPRLRQMKATPKSTSVLPKIEPVRTAIRRYIRDTGRIPGRLEDLGTSPAGVEGWNGPYLKEGQLLDPWGNKFILDYGFRLRSLGADNLKGGTGENRDIEKFTVLIKQSE